jgi:hypothetical protein
VSPAHAEATIDSQTIENGFPRELKFRVTASAPADITDVTLNYAVVGRGTTAIGKPDSLTAAKTLTAEVAITTNSSSSYIPVGSEFVYHWEITTADGKTTSGPEQKYLYLPPGKDWKNVQGDFMTVYFAGSDREVLANAYLKAGLETWQKIGVNLLKTQLKQTPVRVILFDAEKELVDAQAGRGSTFDSQTLTCGTKVATNVVFVIPAACGSADRTDTLRHEFGHIINEAAGESALGKLPSWLDEGTAVYAQTSAGDYVDAFQAGVRANRLIPFGQMTQPTNDPRLVGVFYGQAYFMVKYLIDRGGPEKFAQYFATIKKGSRYDDALKTVYNLSLADFEKEFLASVGAASQPTRAPTQRPAQQATPAATQRPAQQATQAPTKAPVSLRDTASDDGGREIGKATIAIVGAAILLMLFGLLSFLVLMYLQNQRKAAG